jgi:DNA polymerase I-like protein with 3'-5' exonuclease and polymerase domains
MAKVIKTEKHIRHTVLDLEDFIALKKIEPYQEFRFLAKKINFGFLFGLIGKSFAERELMKRWTEQQINDYLFNNNIDPRTISDLEKKYNYKHTTLECKYIAVAEDIRRKFFDKYTGLEKRITDMRKFFKKYGFVRSYYGAFRRDSLVLLEGDEEDKKERAGLDNIMVNTSIQAFEAVVVMRSMVKISRWFRENKLQSRVFGSVHDSVDFYIEISEINIVIPKIRETFEKMYKEYDNVPLSIEMKLGDHYKEGKEI